MTKRKNFLLVKILLFSAAAPLLAQQSDVDIPFDPDLKPKTEQLQSAAAIELVPVPNAAQMDAIEKVEKEEVRALAPELLTPSGIGTAYSARIQSVLKDQPTNKDILQLNVQQSRNLMTIHSLNIGAGSCHVIQCPGARGQKMIIDCGRVGAARPTDRTPAEVGAYFGALANANDVPPIVVSTHPDADHYNYLEAMLNGRKPHSVWLGGVKTSDTAFNDEKKYGGANFYSLVRRWARAGVPVTENLTPRFSNSGDALPELQCGAMKSYVVTVNTGEEDNDQSLMLLVEYGNFRALFGGDAYEASQRAAVENMKDKIYRVNLLTASHHGSNRHGSNDTAWAEATRPGIVIYSSGKPFGHPHCTAVGSFLQVGSLYHAKPHTISCGNDERTINSKRAEYVTDDNGFVIVATDGEGRIGVTCERGGDCSLDPRQVRTPLDLEFEALVED